MANVDQQFYFFLSPSAWVTILIFIICFWALISEIKPPEFTMAICALAFGLFGILSFPQVLQGFSSDILPIIACLCIIVKSLEFHGLLDAFAKKVLSHSKRYSMQLTSVILPAGVMSAFLNNTLVVLLIMPIVRTWAIRNKIAPSKFLIPLSYAVILGGSCTLIGSSTNLIVQALLIQENAHAGFSFFEIGKVGVPLFFCGIVYLLVFSRFLPDRKGVDVETEQDFKQMVGAFLVGEGESIAGRSLNDLFDLQFRGVAVLEVIRNERKISSPHSEFIVQKGDILWLASDIHKIAGLHNIPELSAYTDPETSLDMRKAHFSEIVLPMTSLLIGRTLDEIRFRKNYGATIIAIYRKGHPMTGTIRNLPLKSGDTLIALTDEPARLEAGLSDEFYAITMQSKVYALNPWPAMISLLSLIGVIVLATMGFSLVYASALAALGLLAFRVLPIPAALKSVAWPTLLMIACSFALGKALEVTGLSQQIAHSLLIFLGHSPYLIVGGLLLVTILLTELISNNAAAVVMFPIGLEMLAEMGFHSAESVKAIGAAVLIGSSSGYALPTGYQTHMIVYGPGGYKFTDYIKLGLPLDLLTLVLGTLFVLWAFPMVG